MKQKKVKVKRLVKKSYLALIKNSIGAKSFKNFYALLEGKETDVTQDGFLSCAYFVSSVLTIFGLAKRIHLTVAATVKDLKKTGWKEIEKPRIGAVIIWEKGKTSHQHIGFYFGRKMAISNSTSRGCPDKHHWTFNHQRKIESIWWTDRIKN